MKKIDGSPKSLKQLLQNTKYEPSGISGGFIFLVLSSRSFLRTATNRQIRSSG